jgi:hypothetical protein
MVTLDRDEVRPYGNTRGLGTRQASPLGRIQEAAEQLRRGLRARVPFLAGVAFPHVADPLADPGPEAHPDRDVEPR